ncbi:MAG TPA: polysaccharide biosynthesis protein [Methylovirgula sp.]|nr:polysaccharide biosynthesis protein [Methylovirgula sp.]
MRKPYRRKVNDVARSTIQGRRVLVTGAGGSIGSELVKQLSFLSPAHLALVDSCEFNLYQIDHAIRHLGTGISCAAHLSDVRDLSSMRQVFIREQPDIVFHAAALKHVPLLEELNVIEAVRTNVLGTKIILDLCVSTNTTFVLISTDKAVNPASQMGLTKRVAEILVNERAVRYPETRLSLVRFGNVIGSSGSVIPLFRNQIAAGGPVTVTHPEMTRYLMTVEDAVSLTLAASSLEQNGCCAYILDMGEPVRIFDLAVEMIEMSGRRPFIDIDIQFVGTRPGEKLHEELNYPCEQLQPTSVPGVRVAISSFDPRPRLRHVHELLAAADARDYEAVRRALVQAVPEYRGQGRQLDVPLVAALLDRDRTDGALANRPAPRSKELEGARVMREKLNGAIAVPQLPSQGG